MKNVTLLLSTLCVVTSLRGVCALLATKCCPTDRKIITINKYQKMMIYAFSSNFSLCGGL